MAVKTMPKFPSQDLRYCGRPMQHLFLPNRDRHGMTTGRTWRTPWLDPARLSIPLLGRCKRRSGMVAALRSPGRARRTMGRGQRTCRVNCEEMRQGLGDNE